MAIMLFQIALLVGGFVLLIKGADFFVKGASAIARKLGVPQIVIGLTIVAMGTSAPEAAVSISAAWGGSADITIGNVVGSNILNIFIILGMTALVAPKPLPLEKSTVRIDIPIVLIASLLLLPLGIYGHSVNRMDGVILMLIFVGYMLDLFRQSMKKRDLEEESRPTYGQGNIWTIFLTLIGLVMIIAGSQCTVHGATEIASALGVSQRMIGLTVVAFGTSLPELVTSITAARRGNTGIAIGNIVGSNLFNILFVIGLTAMITPVTFIHAFIFDTCVSAFAALLLWAFALKFRQLGKACGAVFIACYAVYFIYVLI